MNICVRHLFAGYGNKKVLEDVDISFPSNQLTGLIGPNGSGKSTLLKCIYRVMKPSAGQIFVGDKNIGKLSYKESAKQIAVLAQHHGTGFDLSVEDVVLMGRTPYKGIAEGDNAEDIAIAERSMEETGVADMGSLSFIQLSGGEQQRVMLARALTQETSCLILDEPTNHLDITYQLQIMDLVTSRNMTVIAAIHDLNIAAMYCDHIVALQNGKIIAQGTPQEVLTKENIKALYHVNAEILMRADGRPAIIYERGDKR